MTWFIIGSEDGIVGVDEFKNEAYMSELRIGANQSYRFEGPSVPSAGYNDGTYYLGSDGRIHWRSDEVVTIPELPPDTFEVGSVNNPYVFVISGSPAFMEQIKNYGGSILNKVEPLLERLGYYVQFIGWDASGSEFQIAFVKKGTEPISLTLLLLIGIICVTIAFVAWQVRFSIRAFMDGKILIEREDTAQAWIDGNRAVLDDPNASDEDKQKARDNLTNPDLPTTPSENPIPTSPDGSSGTLLGIGSGALLALAIVYFASRKK